MNIIDEVLSLKIQHRCCEDSWYSCPKNPEGCANEDEGDECNCGADSHNAKVDTVVAELQKRGIK